MFGSDVNDMDRLPYPSLFGALGHAEQGEIIAFCRAAGEYDFARLGANLRSDRFPGRIDCLFRFPAVAMAGAAGVAEPLGQIRQHGLKHAGIHRRGRVIIHVDGVVAELAHGFTKSGVQSCLT